MGGFFIYFDYDIVNSYLPQGRQNVDCIGNRRLKIIIIIKKLKFNYFTTENKNLCILNV